METTDKWLTTRQAAEYLGYSDYYLRASRMKDRKLGGKTPPPHYGTGKGIRYKRSDLESWITEEA